MIVILLLIFLSSTLSFFGIRYFKNQHNNFVKLNYALSFVIIGYFLFPFYDFRSTHLAFKYYDFLVLKIEHDFIDIGVFSKYLLDGLSVFGGTGLVVVKIFLIVCLIFISILNNRNNFYLFLFSPLFLFEIIALGSFSFFVSNIIISMIDKYEKNDKLHHYILVALLPWVSPIGLVGPMAFLLFLIGEKNVKNKFIKTCISLLSLLFFGLLPTPIINFELLLFIILSAVGFLFFAELSKWKKYLITKKDNVILFISLSFISGGFFAPALFALSYLFFEKDKPKIAISCLAIQLLYFVSYFYPSIILVVLVLIVLLFVYTFYWLARSA